MHAMSKSMALIKPFKTVVVPSTLYPSIMFSLYRNNVAMAIMMWACVNQEKKISAGWLSRQTGFSISISACFLEDACRKTFLKKIFSSVPDSSLYVLSPDVTFVGNKTANGKFRYVVFVILKTVLCKPHTLEALQRFKKIPV